MLHGYSQNAHTFKKRMSAIRKEAKNCEFVFLNGPHILKPADLPSSLDISTSHPEEDQELTEEETPRAWWRSNEERTIYYGVDKALNSVKNFLDEQMKGLGPIDVVFGFSQGAAMAALLTAILENPSSYDPVSFIDPSSSRPIHPPFKSAIFGSGFLPMPTDLSHLFLPPNGPLGKETSTLHIIGSNDPIVSEQRSNSLVNVCVPQGEERGTRVIVHDGGHFIPLKATWRAFFKKYLDTEQANLAAIVSPVPELADS